MPVADCQHVAGLYHRVACADANRFARADVLFDVMIFDGCFLMAFCHWGNDAMKDRNRENGGCVVVLFTNDCC